MRLPGRRAFNRTERIVLYLAADGKCESCGVALESGWHADHVIPYIRGGTTDVINGQALCPPCNLHKGATMSNPHDDWQDRAMAAWRARKAPDFLAEVTPGGGKTKFALRCAADLFATRKVSLVIVVVPSTALRKYWKDGAAKFDLDLMHDYEPGPIPGDRQGIVVTYGAVGSQPDLFRRHIGQRDGAVLVIFDEIHHAAGEKVWGLAIQQAFELAQHRLMVTGTAFRSDGAVIPFIRYKNADDGKKVCAADFSYLYPEARADGVVVSILFPFLTGEVEFVRDGKQHLGVLNSELSAWLTDDALRVATSPRVGQFVRSALQRGDSELTEQRKTIKDAGGIIFAKSIEDANDIKPIMESICGADQVSIVHLPTATYPLRNPVDVIKEFRNGDQRWIVAVQMISEGIDIPRLQVGVYLSNRHSSELWFRQIVGRLIRIYGGDAQQDAQLFLPWVPNLHRFAEDMCKEVLQGLEEIPPPPPPPPPPGPPRPEPNFTALDSSTADRDHVIDWSDGGRLISDAVLSEAERVKQVTGVTASVSDITRILAAMQGVPSPAQSGSTAERTATEIRDEDRANLRIKLTKWVQTKAYQRTSGRKDLVGNAIKEIWGAIYSESGIKRGVAVAEYEDLQSYWAVIQKWAANGAPWDASNTLWD